MTSFFNKIGIAWSIVFIFFVGFFVWLLATFITIHLTYKPLFDWWTNNGGNKYNSTLNLFTVASANYSRLMYYISKSISSPLNELDIPQVRFILGQLLPYLTYKIDGVQYGLLTPKSLCETVLLSTSDNDDKFNLWFPTFTRTDTINKIKAGIDQNSSLSYTRSDPIPIKTPKGDDTGRKQYTYTPNVDKKTGLFGLYPDPKVNNDWSGLILEWLGYGWVMETDDDGILHPVYNGAEGLASIQLKQWFEPNPELGGRPDNFLARMGIFPDSPLVTYFCANQYSTKSMIVDPQAFANLLGKSGVNAGGWVGFLNGMSGGSHDLDDYINLIRTTTDNPDPPTPPPCTKGDASKGFVAGASTAAGIGGIGLMCMSGGAPGIAVGLAIMAVGIFAGYLSGKDAAKGSCE